MRNGGTERFKVTHLVLRGGLNLGSLDSETMWFSFVPQVTSLCSQVILPVYTTHAFWPVGWVLPYLHAGCLNSWVCPFLPLSLSLQELMNTPEESSFSSLWFGPQCFHYFIFSHSLKIHCAQSSDGHLLGSVVPGLNPLGLDHLWGL